MAQGLSFHYDTLKVSRDAPTEVISAAYRTLALKYHPDRYHGSDATKTMAAINEAYSVLSSPEKRAQYDLWIRNQENKTKQQQAPVWSPEGRKSPKTHQSPAPRHKTGKAAKFFNALGGLLLFFFQLLGARGVVVLFILLVMWMINLFGQNSIGPTTTARPTPGLSSPSKMRVEPSPVAKARSSYQRPAKAPNGVPWPTMAAYIPKMPVKNTAGRCKLTIDNTISELECHAKIIPAEGRTTGIRNIYLPPGSKFTAEKITPGEYYVAYRNLKTGETRKSERFSLEETEMEDGVRYTIMTLTLYTVRGGNTTTNSMEDASFDEI